MKTTIELDASNRIVLSRELRRAAGIPRRQKLMVSATPGRIVLEMEPNSSGRIIKRGKLKVWTEAVIQPRVGATRSELLRLLRGRGFKAKDSQELKAAMDVAAEVVGYAGGD
jgi:hypothetical protein